MRFLNPKSVRFKIVLYTTLCLAVVGIVSNLYLYTYMNGIISQKASDIDALYFETIQMQMNAQLSQMYDLGVLCTSSPEVARALRYANANTTAARTDLIKAQTVLNEYLHSFNSDNYVNRLLAFNEAGVLVQAVAQHDGTLQDYERLAQGNAAILQQQSAAPFSLLLPALSEHRGNGVPGLFLLNTPQGPGGQGYIYIELRPEMFTDMLAPYATLNPILAVTQNDRVMADRRWAGVRLEQERFLQLKDGETMHTPERSYKVNLHALTRSGVKLYSFTDITTISVDNRKMLYTMLVVIFSVLLVSVSTLLIISNSITSPINKLIARIRRISANDFSYDPEIERSGDEIGEIGKVVNEMMMSINTLLRENNEQNEQRRNIEISLLQSQVNPHFLYNTLDSIHWMAVIQKSPGISNMTHSLSNLLKNLAKGTQDKITLREELALLGDYVSIQSIRYLETFEMVVEVPDTLLEHRIVKFTLQPLVENAIFHGIEPTGRCGVITVTARAQDGVLQILVHDNGVGIDPQVLKSLLSPHRRAQSKASLNGIGVNNVDQRLKLVYGKPYGLCYDSVQGSYTRVTVTIPEEVDDV